MIEPKFKVGDLIMTTEEKAKAYDEALEIINDYYQKIRYSSLSSASNDREVLEKAFPVLKENEDKEIRKWLIEVVEEVRKANPTNAEHNGMCSEAHAWLEKQREKKSLNDIAKEVIKDKDTAISFLKSCGIMNENGELADEYKIEQGEKNPAWSEEKPTKEIEPFEAEHGRYYYCIKDYFCGGKKQASKGDVVQALRGLPIMGLKDASEYFLPVNSIKCNSNWSEEDEAIYNGIIETELYMLDVVNGIKKFDVGNVSIKEECTRELNWLRSFYNDLIKNYRDYEDKEI